MASPSSADARRWLARFTAIDAVRRREASRPLESSDSIRLSLSLMATMFPDGVRGLADDPVRRRGEEAVRSVWARLRRASGAGR
jgi:hypothetical protein